MKLLRLFPFLAIALSLTMTSCKEDIDFAGESQKTAIVYALLNQADSIHYIKITRAFDGANNSLEVAQIPDSSYFPVLSATVTEEINGVTVRSWNLQDTVLNNKLPGVFYSPEQKVYYFKTPAGGALSENGLYKLDINVNNGEYHVYGETRLVQSLNIASPTQYAAYNFASANVQTNGYKTHTITINSGTAGVMDARMQVYFNEYFAGVPVEKSYTWQLGQQTGITASQTKFLAVGELFYTQMRDAVTNDPTITRRELTRVKLQITAGTTELNQYLLVNKPSSSLAQNKPTYTNLTATNGARAIGLFSARNTIIQEKQKWVNVVPYYRAIDANSIRELATGQYTGGLLFCSDHPNDNALSYYCN